MKKIIVIAFVLIVLVGFSASAGTLGIGGAFSMDTVGGLPGGALLSLKIPSIPILWGIAFQTGQDSFNLGLTADWWLYQRQLISFLGLYVGPGLYLTLPDNIEIGGRIPIGLNAYPLDFLELFLELAPTLVFFRQDGINVPDFGLMGAFGFRFWFNL
jgi:hypothetical protein